MNTFTLQLQDATHSERIGDATSFVGQDASGSFGILPGHSRIMASLVMGLARFETAGGHWTYLALPGGLLYFDDNQLTISTRRFVLDDDYRRISQALHEQLLSEEEQLHEMKDSLHRMEQEIFQRLWETGRGAPRP